MVVKSKTTFLHHNLHIITFNVTYDIGPCIRRAYVHVITTIFLIVYVERETHSIVQCIYSIGTRFHGHKYNLEGLFPCIFKGLRCFVIVFTHTRYCIYAYNIVFWPHRIRCFFPLFCLFLKCPKIVKSLEIKGFQGFCFCILAMTSTCDVHGNWSTGVASMNS